MNRRLGASLCAALLGAALVALAPAGAAYASTPQCTKSLNIADGDGDVITVAVSSGNSMNCWMAQGDVSTAVGALQKALKYCEGPDQVFTSLVVDNDYGPKTKAAVEYLQTEAQDAGDNITVDGIYGPQTMLWVSWRETNNLRCDTP